MTDAEMDAVRREPDVLCLTTEARNFPMPGATDPVAAMLLRDLMGTISDEAYCAGWMMGLEDDLWAALRVGPCTYGRVKLTADVIANLKRLHDAAGGWWTNDGGERFVTASEWLRMVGPPTRVWVDGKRVER
jgi:hypothetical protein